MQYGVNWFIEKLYRMICISRETFTKNRISKILSFFCKNGRELAEGLDRS
jgi:hypothetical protein